MSQVCASLLSKSLPQKDIAPYVKLYFTNKIDPQVSHVNVSRMSFGKHKFKTSKKLFGELAIGKQVPSQPYRYRVASKSIAVSIEYLQAQLLIVAEQTRSVKIDGNLFYNLPVYSASIIVYY